MMTAQNAVPTSNQTMGSAAESNACPGRRVLLYGLHVDSLTMDQVIDCCEAALRSRTRLQIGVVNAAKIVAMGRDEVLRNSLVDCDLILADGQSVVWASRLLRRRLPERVTGIDLFERLLAHSHQNDRSVFLLGATDQVLTALQANIQRQYPGLRIAGVRNGYFSEAESPEVAEQIRRSEADMLFIGISSPKKETFFATYGPSLGVPILHGVGGSFDVLAGITKRAPVRWQRSGMEWAYRLLQEPRRMWRRYLTTNTRFILKTPREMVRPSAPFAKPLHRVIDLRDPVPTVSSLQPAAQTAPVIAPAPDVTTIAVAPIASTSAPSATAQGA